MAKNRVQMAVAYRKNKNERSRGYNHYYAEVYRAQPLTTRGLAAHIQGHDTSLGLDVIYGVITLLSQCVPELVAQGVPVKIDGLGTFSPTIKNVKMGATEAQMQDKTFTPSSIIDGVRIRFRPEGSEMDNITSKEFLTRAVSVASEFVVESVTRTIDGKEKTITTVQTLEDFRNPEPVTP